MGPKQSKSHRQTKGHEPMHAFEQRVHYYNELKKDKFLPIQFKRKMANVGVLPWEILVIIFASIESISFLGTISRVCQLWYNVSWNEDVLWERFLPDRIPIGKRTGNNNGLNSSNRSAITAPMSTKQKVSNREEFISYSLKQEVFLQRHRDSLVTLPLCFKDKIRAGYQFPTDARGGRQRICILGAGGVGKTSLTAQFAQGVFVEKYDPTIEDDWFAQRQINGKQVLYELQDTAGTEEFSAMRDLYIKNATSYVVVYSVISKATFNDVPDLLTQIYRVNDFTDELPQYSKPIILVGNKADLAPVFRLVSYKMGSDLAEKWNIGFVETSAKSKLNVDVMFHTIAELQMMCATI